MTQQQTIVFGLLKLASNHYRFLLAVICSNSFKSYFELIKIHHVQNVLPVPEQKHLYDDYKRDFYSVKDVKWLTNAEDVKRVEVAEKDAEDVKRVEVAEEDAEDVKRVEVAEEDAEDVKQIEDVEVEGDDVEAEVEGDDFDDIDLSKVVS
jgi:hypothetical protein